MGKKFVVLKWLMVATAAFCLFLPNMAFADHAEPFVEVVCSPDLDYFSLRSFRVADTDIWSSNVQTDSRASEIRKALPKDNIFYLDDFIGADYHCKLPTRDISIQLVGIDGDKSTCFQKDAKVEIKINEKIARSFTLFGGTCPPIVHQIELDKFSLVDCALKSPVLNGDSYQAICSHVKAPSKISP